MTYVLHYTHHILDSSSQAQQSHHLNIWRRPTECRQLSGWQCNVVNLVLFARIQGGAGKAASPPSPSTDHPNSASFYRRRNVLQIRPAFPSIELWVSRGLEQRPCPCQTSSPATCKNNCLSFNLTYIGRLPKMNYRHRIGTFFHWPISRSTPVRANPPSDSKSPAGHEES